MADLLYTVFSLNHPETNEIKIVGFTTQTVRARIGTLREGMKYKLKNNLKLSLCDLFILSHPNFSVTIHLEGADKAQAVLLKEQLIEQNSSCTTIKNSNGKAANPFCRMQIVNAERSIKRKEANIGTLDAIAISNPNPKRGPNGKFI